MDAHALATDNALRGLCGVIGDFLEDAEAKPVGQGDPERNEAYEIEVSFADGATSRLVVPRAILDLPQGLEFSIKFGYVVQRPLGDLLRRGTAVLGWDADRDEFTAELLTPRP